MMDPTTVTDPYTTPINPDVVTLMCWIWPMGNAPTMVSEPSGPNVAPWAIWDFADVVVCGKPMTLQVTFTPPAYGEVEVQAISMYPTPEGRRP